MTAPLFVDLDKNEELERLRYELSEVRRRNAELGQVFDAEVRALKRELDMLKPEQESASCSRCYICDGHARCQGAMCSKCARSFKRSLDRQHVCLFDAMAWAANRMRKLERRRVGVAGEVGHG